MGDFDEKTDENANKNAKHWECKFCEKKYKYQSSLCKHVTKKHKNSKQTVMIFCEDCEKVKEVKIIQIILK